MRARQFVGQAKAMGDEGKDEQKGSATWCASSDREFNVLVATSIGEEGSTIGGPDHLLRRPRLPDAHERYGRTGRKHDGRIVTLMTEGYEEIVHERGAEKFQKMRKAIRNPGNQLTFCPPDEFYPTKHMRHEKQELALSQPEATPASDLPRRRGRKAAADGGDCDDADELTTRSRRACHAGAGRVGDRRGG